VGRIAEQVNALLTASIGFQQYFSIVDGDIERSASDPTEGRRLFRLPVYHVENLLIHESGILEVTRSMMGSKCPYGTVEEVSRDLRELVLSEAHLKSYAKSLLDARLAKLAKAASDAVYQQRGASSQHPEIPRYCEIEKEAKALLKSSVADGSWRSKCKGRDLLKAYCGQQGIKYEHFRNSLVARIETPPKALADIMGKILES
jgi:hypothetical protein